MIRFNGAVAGCYSLALQSIFDICRILNNYAAAAAWQLHRGDSNTEQVRQNAEVLQEGGGIGSEGYCLGKRCAYWSCRVRQSAGYGIGPGAFPGKRGMLQITVIVVSSALTTYWYLFCIVMDAWAPAGRFPDSSMCFIATCRQSLKGLHVNCRDSSPLSSRSATR